MTTLIFTTPVQIIFRLTHEYIETYEPEQFVLYL